MSLSVSPRPRVRHCKLCSIVLFRAGPPSPCFRAGCRFARAQGQHEPSSPVQSSLAGGDFSEVR